MLTKEELIEIIKPTKYIDDVLDKLVDSLNQVFTLYKINTTLRQNHFLAQVIHESGAFRYKEEIASGKAYEGRKDLGNINIGDGIKYKGRGVIQITGKSNYEQASRDFKVDFVKNPELAAEFPYCTLIAGWYWDKKNLNMFADNDDILTITKRINGGTNGLASRKQWLVKCKQVNNK